MEAVGHCLNTMRWPGAPSQQQHLSLDAELAADMKGGLSVLALTARSLV